MAYTTINKSSDYFRTKIYTGNGTDDRDITWDESSNMQPDMLWSKRRDSADNHSIYDIVRGSGLELRTNTTDADLSRTNNIQALQTNGFQVGTDSQVNASGGTYVSWGWKANGAGVANTDGSISSTVSANTTSGFSIVSYSGNSTSGATVGHSLGTAPSTIIVKVLNEGTYNWNVYHKSLGATKTLKLNLTNAEQVSSIRWNDTEPTSSVFSLGNAGEVNETGKNYIAYCFAEKQGYSKFGSYTGNGSADGTFVYTGFKPAMVILKGSSIAENWWIYDNKRNTSNLVTRGLNPSTSGAELDYANPDQMNLDFLSNGFKLKSYDGALNGSGQTYIYMAFAEQPLVGDNPATAR
ncbi:tail fiber protein [Pelagibacter phage HTVC011P]|uniref:DUF7483 domain-containing protein n=1 Tax=Pelagibacter phage HTVC011P TaxID=1283078 RepID=M1ID83_9CAUD|nr:tail fiber protein [Pelagibacter phage HTVC011P]AGE60569.1 hypothetical protein [Pelagibacter phage HTVC011P]